MLPWPRDIIFEVSKKFENLKISESKIPPWDFSEYDKNLGLTKISGYKGNPIEIDSNVEITSSVSEIQNRENPRAEF